MFPKPLNQYTNVQLLNQILQNTFEEFDANPKNRNTFIEGNQLVRWVDSEVLLGAPTKEVLRDCTEEELVVWESYTKMVRALSALLVSQKEGE